VFGKVSVELNPIAMLDDVALSPAGIVTSRR